MKNEFTLKMINKVKVKIENLGVNESCYSCRQLKNVMGGDTYESGGGQYCLSGNYACKKWNAVTLQFDYGACRGTGTDADPCKCSLGAGAITCVKPIMR